MHNCRSNGPTSSIYDHFIIWPSSVTLTFNRHEQTLQMALLLFKKKNCATLFWNPCINVEVMAQFMTILSVDLQVSPWPSTYVKKFQMVLLLLKESTCAKLFWNSCINVEAMAGTSSIMTILSFDLQVWPWPSTYVNKCFKWHNYSSRRKLCQIILKSMHKCRRWYTSLLSNPDLFVVCLLYMYMWKISEIK